MSVKRGEQSAERRWAELSRHAPASSCGVERDQLVPPGCWSNKEPSAHMAATNCGAERLYASTRSVRASPQAHMALSAGPLTSVDDGPVVVEDYPALVQGRDCVQQVEGAQIPLRLQLRKNPTQVIQDNFNLS